GVEGLRQGRGHGAVVARERADGVVAPLPGHAGRVGERGLLAEMRREGPPHRVRGILLLRHGRPATSSASSIVNACAYRAFPTIAPSTPCGTSSRSARRSSSEEIPPEATTFASVREQTSRSRSRLGPRRVPSLVTSDRKSVV